MLGRSPGRTPGVLSNRTAVPVRLLSRASPPPRPSPFEGEGAHGDALGQCASRVPWGRVRVGDRSKTAADRRVAQDSSPTRAPTQTLPHGGRAFRYRGRELMATRSANVRHAARGEGIPEPFLQIAAEDRPALVADAAHLGHLA